MDATVDVITTDGPTGRAGFTASAICSMVGTSPTLLVCLSCGASVWPVFNGNRTLCVSTLNTGQEPLSNLFGGRTPMERRFAATRWQTGTTGCPQLEEALVPSDCRIGQMVSTGTHNILFCAIEAIHRHATPCGPMWLGHSHHALVRPVC